jgi:succinate dehydrogenase / fumarate reductase flavoprotein subunit
MSTHHDVLIIGSGLAGLRACLETVGSASTAVFTKVFPTRAHSCAAQGGISAALGNVEEDNWEWHMFDTVKGGDFLTDEDAAEILAKDAPRAVIELEHFGVPFSRTGDGRIAQRNFGGHTRPNPDPALAGDNNKRVPVRRACHAADRTGHAMLHTLHDQAMKRSVNFYSEWFVLKLIIEDGTAKGLIAMNMISGEIETFTAKAIMLATGGYCRAFKINSNALTNTGDGCSLVWEAGLPLQDMEFVQFHPTGLYKLGILVSEAARGEGGILYNSKHERFMERYAPSVKDLAPRDMVSRAIMTEVKEGRGIGGKDYVNLDVSHLGKKFIDEKLPDVTGFARTYLGVDPYTEPIPVQPTAHYAMGGIPTDLDGRVKSDEKGGIVKGLYAAGEVACVSVHGANRLGTNSLTDTVVFGRRTGMAMREFVKGSDIAPIRDNPFKQVAEQVETLRRADGPEHVADIRTELQSAMMDRCSVFREKAGMTSLLNEIRIFRGRAQKVGIKDRGRTFNTDLIDAMELRNVLTFSEVLVQSALAREESRGGHARLDFEKRDDASWRKHTYAFPQQPGNPETPIELRYAQVRGDKYKPVERKY